MRRTPAPIIRHNIFNQLGEQFARALYKSIGRRLPTTRKLKSKVSRLKKVKKYVTYNYPRPNYRRTELP